jgi:phage-related tail protein
LTKEADMATTQTRNSTPSIDGVFERAGEAQEQFAAAARKAGKAYLDSYEKAVDRATELQLKLADSTQQDWIKSIAETQADFARELANTYTSTARTLLK